MKSILNLAFALVALFSVSTVSAQNLVVKQQPYAIDLGKDLQLCIDFAGLGNISKVDIEIYYTAEVKTVCYNQGQDKKGTGPVPGLTREFSSSTSVSFDVHNGRARGCKPLNLYFAPGECPSGNMRGDVSDVTFTNIHFTILGQEFYLDDPQKK